jgi:hypothetical protein
VPSLPCYVGVVGVGASVECRQQMAHEGEPLDSLGAPAGNRWRVIPGRLKPKKLREVVRRSSGTTDWTRGARGRPRHHRLGRGDFPWSVGVGMNAVFMIAPALAAFRTFARSGQCFDVDAGSASAIACSPDRSTNTTRRRVNCFALRSRVRSPH